MTDRRKNPGASVLTSHELASVRAWAAVAALLMALPMVWGMVS